MKKLIAISVMLVLIAGAVFAETSVSGAVETHFQLVGNSGQEDAKNHSVGADGNNDSYTIADAWIQLSGQNDEGTMGGALRVKPYYNNSWEGDGIHKANVWWQPIPQLRIFLGKDDDGMFGTDELVSWNYYQAGTAYMSEHDWGLYRDFFPGNWDKFGLAFIIKPVDALEVDVTLNSQGDDRSNADWRTNDLFKAIRVSANYAIDGIGKIFFVYNGPANFDGNPPTYTSDADDDFDGWKTKGQVAASFQLTAVEGFKIQPGFAIKLADTKNWKIGTEDAKNPTHIGLGLWYTGEGFGVKLRGGYILNVDGNEKTTQLVIGVLPYYNISDNVTGFLQFEYNAKTTDDSDDYNDPATITVFPSIRAGFGSGTVAIGVKIQNFNETTTGGKSHTSWAVPVLFAFSF